MAKRGIYLLCGIFLILISMSACEPGPDELVQAGEILYVSNCGRCHAQDGGGYDPLYPQLNENPIVTLHDSVPVIQIVVHGQGSMPAFRDMMNDHEIAAVVTYIRQAWDNDARPVQPRQIQAGREPNGGLPNGSD